MDIALPEPRSTEIASLSPRGSAASEARLRAAVIEQHQRSDADFARLRSNANAGSAGHGNEPPPVQCLRECRLHEQGIRDGLRRPPRVVVGCGAADGHCNQLGRPRRRDDTERELSQTAPDPGRRPHSRPPMAVPLCLLARSYRIVTEYSPSTVMALNVVDDFGEGALKRHRHRRVGRHERQHRRQHGSIMPEPLAMPPIVTSRPPAVSCVAALGNGSVVTIARAACGP